MRDHWRQPHLQAFEAPGRSTPSSAGRWREPGDDAFSLLTTTAVVEHEGCVTEVEEQRDSRMRNDRNVDEIIRPIAEACHGDPRQPAGP